MFCQRNKIGAVFSLLILTIFFGCGGRENEKDFVAKVNDSFLSPEEVERDLSSLKHGNQFREEYIRNWVKREALFMEAKKTGLLEGEEYKSLIEDARKELAVSLLLEKISSKFSVEADETVLRAFYDLHKEEFRIPADAFVINRITFAEKERAIKFRTAALDSGWAKAATVFKDDPALLKNETDKFIYYYEVYPVTLVRYMKYLDPSETSVVFESEPNMFSVVQVINKFKEGEIPPFDEIKNDVKDKYIMIARTDSLETYIENLMPHYNIEIKKDLQ